MTKHINSYGFAECNSWEGFLTFMQNEGKAFGWELREPEQPLDKSDLDGYREAGVPESELPPKYMEVWKTKELDEGKEHKVDPPEYVGIAAVSYVLNGTPWHAPYRNLFMIRVDKG